MTIDIAQCHDCNNCFMACKDEHVGNDWPGYTAAQPRHGHRWINIERRERGQYARNDVAYLPMPCQQCQEAHCMKAAPDAITRRADGVVMIDPVKAKGNQRIWSTPAPSVRFTGTRKPNVAQKCTMCAHLLDEQGLDAGRAALRAQLPDQRHERSIEMEPAEFEKLAKKEGLEGYRSAELKNQPHVFYKNLLQVHQEFHHCRCAGERRLLRERHGHAEEQDRHRWPARRRNFFGEFKFDALESGEYTVDIEAAGQKTSCKAVINNDSQNLGFIKLAAAKQPVRA